MATKLTLRRLSEYDELPFFQGLKAFEGEDLDWYTFDWKEGMSFSELLDRLEKNEKGAELPSGFVPNTMLYGFVEDKIVGRLHIRHKLNDHLRFRGGHLGYAVAPNSRGQGYATEMLQQGLKECHGLGLEKVLITCGDKNRPSWKVIENVGAYDYTLSIDLEARENLRRYWINL
jgi:predicted acetyltransferase